MCQGICRADLIALSIRGHYFVGDLRPDFGGYQVQGWWKLDVGLQYLLNGFRDQGSGCRVQGLGLRFEGTRFRVEGSGSRV